jgi:hypothetical protein
MLRAFEKKLEGACFKTYNWNLAPPLAPHNRLTLTSGKIRGEGHVDMDDWRENTVTSNKGFFFSLFVFLAMLDLDITWWLWFALKYRGSGHITMRRGDAMHSLPRIIVLALNINLIYIIHNYNFFYILKIFLIRFIYFILN